MRDVDGVVDVDDDQNAGDSAGVHDVDGEDSARTCMMLANANLAWVIVGRDRHEAIGEGKP